MLPARTSGEQAPGHVCHARDGPRPLDQAVGQARGR
jgi:hypothetical protein